MGMTKMITAVCLDARAPIRLHDIQSRIFRRYGVMYETTTISAAIRKAVRPALGKQGLYLYGKRQAPDIMAYVYWVGKK